MFSLLFLTLLYFLPAIIGRDKSDATGIFLLNLFLGWTLIGWVAAFIWPSPRIAGLLRDMCPLEAGTFAYAAVRLPFLSLTTALRAELEFRLTHLWVSQPALPRILLPLCGPMPRNTAPYFFLSE